MGARAYADKIKDAYEDEIRGEHGFRILAAHRCNAEEAAKLSALADLERLTRQRLEPIVHRLRIICTPEATLRADAQNWAEPLRTLPWPELMESLVAELPGYVAEYDAFATAGPAEDTAALAFLAAHERALLQFARAERADGHSLTSLNPVLALLKSPAPMP
jgi:hypothetical protein